MTSPLSIPRFRKFIIPGEGAKGLMYNTWTQRVALFEGDSAEVAELLTQHSGDLAPALDFMVARGQFLSQDPRNEALAILNSFMQSLHEAGLLKGRLEAKGVAGPEARVQMAVDPELNPELQIASAMSAHRKLYSLVLELTYRCNERCVHCYCPENRDIPEMPTEVIVRLLQEFQALGGFRLQLTGGEALLRPDILTILRQAKDLGLLVDLISNLTLLKPEILAALIDLAPREVGCSVYSADPEIHDRITEKPGSHRQTLAAVRQLRAEGIPVLLKSPLMKETLPGWPALKDLAESLGCGWQCDLSITPRNDGGQNPIDLRSWDQDSIRSLFGSALYHIAAKDEPAGVVRGASPDAALCGAGSSGLAISPDGTIRPCIGLMDELGRYPEHSLEEVWHQSPWFSEWERHKLSDIESCRDCDKVRFCSRCPGARVHGDWRPGPSLRHRPTPVSSQKHGNRPNQTGDIDRPESRGYTEITTISGSTSFWSMPSMARRVPVRLAGQLPQAPI